MIPKIIHYCWFGGAPKPESVIKCINSWKEHCADFQIIEWNEKNFDIGSCPRYVIDAYENKKWAFATDYIRLRIIYENGGVYFDTDVELLKGIHDLLQYNAFFGFEDGKHVNTGLGFGAEPGISVIKEMMDEYNSLEFILPDGSLNQETCPAINTRTLLKYGLVQNDKRQILDDGIMILPSIYMCPIDYETGKMKRSRNTISIHWFDATWMSKDNREYHEKHRKRLKTEKADYWKYLPNRILMKLLGNERYEKLKNQVKQ